MAAIDVKAVAQAANTRPDEGEATYEVPVKKLGSRVTQPQVSVVTDVLTKSLTETIRSDMDALAAYADTGDKSHLSAEQNEAISKVVAQARERLSDNPSKARRVWPRKVAAIVHNIG